MKLRVYNKTLDPSMWDDKTLKPEVKESLLKIAEDFYNSTDLTGDVHNILFLGSSANYNWTPTSDIDVHVVIDIAEEKINEEYARKFMDGLAAKWNTEHDIEVKGHPVEIYLQDLREPNSTPQQARPGAAIYSLYDDKWLLEPNPQNIKLDADKVRRKFQSIKKKIEELVQTEDFEKMKGLMKSIRNYRNAGLAEGGEFSIENIVFKALRHSGDLTRLKDTINTIYDRKRSLPEEGNILPHKKTKPLNELFDKNSQLFLGFINRENFSVVGWSVNNSYVSHQDIYERVPYSWKSINIKPWRYRKDLNKIYWWYGATETEKTELSHWLEKTLGVKFPQHLIITPDAHFDDKNRMDSHGYELNELLSIIKSNLNYNFISF